MTDKLTIQNAELGKSLYVAATEERRKEKQDEIVHIVKSLIMHRESLEADIAKQNEQLQLVAKRLSAIEAGDFVFDPRGAHGSEIRFNDEALR
jgi:hypothetical protein